MKALLRSWIVRGVALMMAASVAASVATAQDRAPFRQEELDQMLAPIALYPDPLLSQILMASTYPLEVVQASRWSRANPSVKGQDAVRAVEPMDWDPSVKSLAAFPQVLAMMDSKLEWTESLGEAFMGQQAEVMNTVQALRRKADAAGNLLSSDQMRVAREGEYIYLAPPAPEIVYVPYYDPMLVYGPWWWPAYPPVFWAPPAYYVGPAYRPGFYWGSGISISATFFFGHADWRRHRVTVVRNQVSNVTVNRTTVINAPAARSRTVWQHDPAHRRGAPFQRAAARQQFEQRASAAGTAPASRSAARPAPSSIQQRQPGPREATRVERRDPAQSRIAPENNRQSVIQGGRPAARQDSRGAQPGARNRAASPAPQASERRDAPRPQAQSTPPRPAATAPAAPRATQRQAERREAPRPQAQSNSPRPAPAAPASREAHPNPQAAGAAHAAGAQHPPSGRSNGNPERSERSAHGNDR